MTLVKICGITDVETAEFAAKEGAAFIGLIFEPSSHRYVTPEEAKEIAAVAKRFGAIPVGVFTDHDAQEIQVIAKQVGLETLQLYGQKARAACSDLPAHYTRLFVLYVESNGKVQHEDLKDLNPKRDFLVYDGVVPGSGQTFNWENFQPEGSFRFFLAGGLNPDNVQLAIKMKHPAAVDVSTGVENPETKKKDLGRIRLFIQKVQEVI